MHQCNWPTELNKVSINQVFLRYSVYSLWWLPVEATEDVQSFVLASMQIQTQDCREDEQDHSKIKHHHNSSLETVQSTGAIRRKAQSFHLQHRTPQLLSQLDKKHSLHSSSLTVLVPWDWILDSKICILNHTALPPPSAPNIVNKQVKGDS